MIANASTRSLSISCAFFFTASERSFPPTAEAFVTLASRGFIAASSFLTSAARNVFNSASVSAVLSSVIASVAALMPSLATVVEASTSSALEFKSADVFSLILPILESAVSVSSFATFSEAAVVNSVAATTFDCNFSFAATNSFSLASLACLRFSSKAPSRATPIIARSLCKFSFVTPGAPSWIKTLQMESSTSGFRVNLNSPFEYACTSFLLSLPSLSVSYFLKVFSIAAIFSFASAFLIRDPFCVLQAAMASLIFFFTSTSRVVSAFKSFAKV
mmetsp:Transcript_45615/g.72153  ORF Transcript_45615/g.72153 Transcript_45615/m.72153 type:complete len:275 (+) Transcript_45615:844-1668(+)